MRIFRAALAIFRLEAAGRPCDAFRYFSAVLPKREYLCSSWCNYYADIRHVRSDSGSTWCISTSVKGRNAIDKGASPVRARDTDTKAVYVGYVGHSMHFLTAPRARSDKRPALHTEREKISKKWRISIGRILMTYYLLVSICVRIFLHGQNFLFRWENVRFPKII